VYADGTGFRLSLGRYREDGFVLAYASDGGWYSDT
jgi:hypothetical protein